MAGAGGHPAHTVADMMNVISRNVSHRGTGYTEGTEENGIIVSKLRVSLCTPCLCVEFGNRYVEWLFETEFG